MSESKYVQCPNCGGYKLHDLHGINFLDVGLIFLWGLGLLTMLYKQLTKPKDGSHEYRCDLCGYQWHWKPGTPYPAVSVRPDLIAKGEQKLREEEQRRLRN